LGSIQESETLQYSAGVKHQQHAAHFVAFAAVVLARQPVAELVQHLDQGHGDAQ
jgi:hypothetical protein